MERFINEIIISYIKNLNLLMSICEVPLLVIRQVPFSRVLILFTLLAVHIKVITFKRSKLLVALDLNKSFDSLLLI